LDKWAAENSNWWHNQQTRKQEKPLANIAEGFLTYERKIMSHFVKITSEIKDIEALRAACEELGLELFKGAEARGFDTERQSADFVVRLKGPHDVAVERGGNGAYCLSADWFGGHVEREVGKNCGRLLQLYAVHKAAKEARRRGLMVMRRPLKNGSIKLTIGGV
jgi:hypothetical protein